MRIHVLTALVASALLTACGGGGGGSVAPPTGGGGGTTNAVLSAGFAQTSGKAAQMRTARRITFAMPQAALGGSIYPFAIFFAPDSYVPQNAMFTIGYQAIAYMTGNNIPNPLPTATFSQISGPQLQFLGSVAPANVAVLPNGATSLGGESVGAPSTPGQTVVSIAAGGQSVNITADTYPATFIATTPNSLKDSPVALTCTSSGCAPTTSGTPDLSITAGTPSSFSAPNGIVEVQKTIDEITSADFVNASTTFAVTDFCTTPGIHSFIFKTANGSLVKFEAQGVGGTNLNAGVCQWTDAFGPYLASDASGNFAY